MHTLLKAAHDAAPASARPSPPYHGGVEANPQLQSFGTAGVALFLADVAAPLVKRSEKKRFAEFLAPARPIYDKHAAALGTEKKRGTKSHLSVLSKAEAAALHQLVKLPAGYVGVDDSLSPALASANAAAVAALDLEWKFGGGEVLAALRRTLVRVVPLLPPPEVHGFLVELDRLLLREELRALLAERRDSRAAKVEACLWRAGAGKAREGRAAGARVTHWIGRLDAGTFVLVQKVGARWEVFDGGRDDILATVPDEHMESATNAVIASSPAASGPRSKASSGARSAKARTR